MNTELGKAEEFIKRYLITANINKAAEGFDLIYCDSASALSFYVYALIDPRDDSIFYIGKGVKRRWLQHGFEGLKNSKKWSRIQAIERSGALYRAIYLLGCKSESEAYLAERLLIQTIGLKRLTNLSRGEVDVKMRNVIKAADLVLSLRKGSTHPWAAHIAENAQLALELALKDLSGSRDASASKHKARTIRAGNHQG